MLDHLVGSGRGPGWEGEEEEEVLEREEGNNEKGED